MKVSEYFGENVFSRAVMQERLPKKVYAEVMSVVEHGGQISMASADVVAKAMMEWAIEKGATHYTHWFSRSRASRRRSTIRFSPRRTRTARRS